MRTTLDLQFEGKTLAEDYALEDVYIDGDLPATDFHIFSSEHGFMGLFPMGRRHFRLIASHPLSKPSKDTAPALAELQEIYDLRAHIPARFRDLVWSSWFRNSRMVSRLKVGRLLLGGDAAHIHSPAGARGMNTGIQDMINLGWKLALVINGQAPATLLDTYEQDRLPALRNVLIKTDALTDVISFENPVVRSLLNHLGPWIGGAGIVQKNATARMSQIALGYRDCRGEGASADRGRATADPREGPGRVLRAELSGCDARCGRSRAGERTVRRTDDPPVRAWMFRPIFASASRPPTKWSSAVCRFLPRSPN